jgi:uncharacterized C2H2 Zn-finger protein
LLFWDIASVSEGERLAKRPETCDMVFRVLDFLRHKDKDIFYIKNISTNVLKNNIFDYFSTKHFGRTTGDF